jgi:hypothetical protein
MMNEKMINTDYFKENKKRATLSGCPLKFILKTRISFYPRITS